MLNVFVISSDKRVRSLIEHFQPFFKTKIRCASDFDNGLKEVFENRPSVVFIQSTIGTVSGETVSRHIKSLLGSESPRIVFLGESDVKGKSGTSWCDDWIRISDSEQQLQQDFAELFSRCFPTEWREIHEEIENRACADSKNIAEPHSSDEDISPAAPLRQEVADESDSGPSGTLSGTSIPEKNGGLTVEIPSPGSDIIEEEVFPAYQNLYDDPSLVTDVSRKKRRSVVKLVAAIFLLAVAAAGFYLWKHHDLGEQQSVSPPSPASKSSVADRPAPSAITITVDDTGLPTFLRSDWRDPLYSSQHPGWERFLSPEVDFRLFREKGTIKALQGISRKQIGISEAFLADLLKQCGFNGPLPKGIVELKNGILVKSVVLPGGAELVTYQEQEASHLKAFVLEFS
jgi:flagellar FliL protein